MEIPEGVSEWLRVQPRVTPIAFDSSTQTLRLAMNTSHITLDAAIEELALVIESTELTLVVQGRDFCPRRLTVARSPLREVRFEQVGDLPELCIENIGEPSTLVGLHVEQSDIERVILVDSAIAGAIGSTSSIGAVHVHDSSLRQASDRLASTLVLEGNVKLQDLRGVEETIVAEESHVSAEGQVGLGQVRASGALSGTPVSLKISGPGEISIRHLPPHSTIFMETESARLALRGPSKAQEGLRFQGSGGVAVVQCALLVPEFLSSEANSIHLHVGSTGAVLEARGRVQISADGGSIVRGWTPKERMGLFRRQTPHQLRTKTLQLESVHFAEGAELQEVDIYDLSLADLLALKKAERLSPWIPRKRSSRRHFEDSTTFNAPTDDVHLRSRRAAHFWNSLSSTLKETHAPGTTQSRARYAAYRQRWRSQPGGAEGILLSVYRWIGFGERIFLPLLAHLALSTGLGLLFLDPSKRAFLTREHLGAYARTFSQALLAPLAIFRVSLSEPPTGFWFKVVFNLAGALGVFLFFLSLSAMRRITKGE